MLALAALPLACSSGGSPDGHGTNPEQSGSVGLRLQVGAFPIATVHYVISNAQNHYEGDIDVADASVLDTVIGGIQAGADYHLSLSATAVTNSEVVCSGDAGPFTVTARSTVNVNVELTCKAPSHTGSVLVNGTLNACPNIDSISSSPPVGNVIALHSVVTDSDGLPQPLSLTWTASSGVLSDATIANPTLTCTTAGIVDLTLTASDGDPNPACADHFALEVLCPAVQAQDGGAQDGGATSEDAGDETGSILVIIGGDDARAANVCPAIDVAFGDPAVGNTVQLHTIAHDSDNDPLTYSWTTAAGTLDDPSLSDPVLTCPTPAPPGGFVSLTVTVSDGDPTPGCDDSFGVIVICP
jgi:hypothetical protein